ncbi:hypothetical protein AB0C76_39190 [Kitasatospora sp. NPDC048722]|uniref:hypothetical protein n=1 Tax=Kitasatospora sp. NPDC048722 TaxID=3155639 RepID=UPI0033EB148C
MAHFKRFAWAAGLLALAFPAAAKTVLAFVAALVALLLAHPAGACAAGAGLLLASTLPAAGRRAARAHRRRQVRGLMSTIRFDIAGGAR